MSRLIILGAGGHGRSVAEAVLAAGVCKLVGFLDDAYPEAEPVWGIPVLGKIADWMLFKEQTDYWFVAIGNNVVRATALCALEDAGQALATVMHPRAMVSPRATLGNGSTIMAGAVVGAEAILGLGAIVNSGVVVDHTLLCGRFWSSRSWGGYGRWLGSW